MLTSSFQRALCKALSLCLTETRNKPCRRPCCDPCLVHWRRCWAGTSCSQGGAQTGLSAGLRPSTLLTLCCLPRVSPVRVKSALPCPLPLRRRQSSKGGEHVNGCLPQGMSAALAEAPEVCGEGRGRGLSLSWAERLAGVSHMEKRGTFLEGGPAWTKGVCGRRQGRTKLSQSCEGL